MSRQAGSAVQMVRQIHSESLTSQVCEDLRRRILRQELKAGTPLNRSELCEEYRVSITPVREALSLLARDGLVVIKPRSSTVVAPLDTDRLHYIFQARLMVETFALEVGAAMVKEPEIHALRQIVSRMAELEPPESLHMREELRRLDHDFHLGIVRLAGNPVTEGFYEQLHFHTFTFRTMLAVAQPYRTRQNAHEHRAIVEALAIRDGETAKRVLTEHVQGLRRAIEGYVPARPENRAEIVR